MKLSDRFVEWAGLEPAAAELISGWEFYPYERAGEVIAIAAMAGFEIHFAVRPDYRGRLLYRTRIREFLAPMFEGLGFLTTRVTHGDEHPAHAFVQRLGFEKTGRDDVATHYMLSALPFGRGEL